MSHVALRINSRVFTVFLIVGLLLLAGASLFILGIGHGRLRASYGTSLSQVADHTAAAVDAYMFRRIIDASILARVPAVRAEAAAGSRRPFDLQADDGPRQAVAAVGRGAGGPQEPVRHVGRGVPR